MEDSITYTRLLMEGYPQHGYGYEQEIQGSTKKRYWNPRSGGWFHFTMQAASSPIPAEKKEIEDIYRRLTYWIWQHNHTNKINENTPPDQLPTIDTTVLKDAPYWQIPPIDTRMHNILMLLYEHAGGQLGIEFGWANIYANFSSMLGGQPGHTTMIDPHKLNVRYSSTRSNYNYKDTEYIFLCMKAAAYSAHDTGFISLLNAMVDEKILDKSKNGDILLKLTIPGYRILEERRRTQSASTTCFVAMWFDDSTNDLYNRAIEPAIQEAGYMPSRIDYKQHNNKIDDEIIAGIRSAKFMIADFTSSKEMIKKEDEKPSECGNIYYEAGFARALDKPVISLCRKDYIKNKKIAFDTQAYNHITWENGEWDALKEAIKHRIEATIGKGPIQQSGKKSE